MHISELVPENDENGSPRAFFAGTTGSGKTTLMMKMIFWILENENPLILIFDTDGMWDYQDYSSMKWKRGVPVRITKMSQIVDKHTGFFIYCCDYPATRDPMVGMLMEWAFNHGYITLIVDEVGDFGNGITVIDILGNIIKKGRKKRIRVFIGYQRSQGIPVIVVTESSYFFIFELRSEKDRERLADRVHPDFFTKMEDYDFMAKTPYMRDPVVIRGGKKRYGDRKPGAIGVRSDSNDK